MLNVSIPPSEMMISLVATISGHLQVHLKNPQWRNLNGLKVLQTSKAIMMRVVPLNICYLFSDQKNIYKVQFNLWFTYIKGIKGKTCYLRKKKKILHKLWWKRQYFLQTFLFGSLAAFTFVAMSSRILMSFSSLENSLFRVCPAQNWRAASSFLYHILK